MAEGVECQLPVGFRVSNVDVEANALVALVSQDVGEIRFTVRANDASLEALLSDQLGAGDGRASRSPTVASRRRGVEASVDDRCPRRSCSYPPCRTATSCLRPRGADRKPVVRTAADRRLALGAAPDAGQASTPGPLDPRVVPGPDLPDGARMVSVAIDDNQVEVGVRVSADAARGYLAEDNQPSS